MAPPRVVVVGAGPTGLRAALGLLGHGLAVDLLSLTAPRREPVATAAPDLAVGLEEDAHVRDACEAAGGGADRRALRALVRGSGAVADELSRLGVPLRRTAEGELVRRPGTGHRADRLVDADEATGALAVRALCAALPGGAGALRRLPGWEVVALTRAEDGRVSGVVAQDLTSMELSAFPAAAVVIASGGFPRAWAPSTSAAWATGAGLACAARLGARLASPDRLEIAPLAVVRTGKAHPMPASLWRLGVVWSPTAEDERRRPGDVPPREREVLFERDATSSDASLVAAMTRSIRLGRRVFLDLRGAPRAGGDPRAEARAALWGGDPRLSPIPVAPAAHATLGGLDVELSFDDAGELRRGSPRNHATSVPGLFAAGGAAAAYRGSARLPGHRLLEALFGGALVADAVAAEVSGHASAPAPTAADLEAARSDEEAQYRAILARHAGRGERPEELSALLGDAMWSGAGPLAEDSDARALEATLPELHRRAREVSPWDGAVRANRGAPAARRLASTALLARLAAAATAARRARAAEGAADGEVLCRWEGDEPRTEARDAAS